jgi:phage tail protein X
MPVKTGRESASATGDDIQLLFERKYGKTITPAPTSLVVDANPGHRHWHVVFPCVSPNPANNKSYDHRLVTLDEWPSESPPRPELWPSEIPFLAGDPRAIQSLKSVAAGSGALAFVRAASQLDSASWAVIANVADGAMHEQAAAFDIFTGIYWPLRNRQAGVPSRQAAWMTLKLMATVSQEHRTRRAGSAAQPWKSLSTSQPPQKMRNGKLRVYPRRIPTDGRLERELREIIDQELSKSPHASIDWPGLCQFLHNVLP